MRTFAITSALVLASALSVAHSQNTEALDETRVLTPSETKSLFDADFRQVNDKSVILWGTRWRSPTIPVCWENPEAVSQDDLDLIKQSVLGTWAAFSCLSFTGWQKCASNNRGIRIRISDEGPHAKGLGRLLDGVPDGVVLNLTYQNWGQSCRASESKRDLCTKSIAVHEFGHGLGFAHEQNRWDTPGECLRPPQGTSGDVFLTEWDIDSALNYCNPTYANDGELSEGDIQGLQVAYCAPNGQLN